jgi:DNA-binding response OmpR family regulator
MGRLSRLVKGSLELTENKMSRTKKIVLIVEDEPEQAQAVKTVLERERLFEGAIVGTAQEALDFLRDPGRVRDLVLIVLDIDLEEPGLGFPVLGAASNLNKRIPVIVLTGRDTVAFDEQASLLAGAADYMTKPFRPDVLLQKARNLIKLVTSSQVTDFGNGYSWDSFSGVIQRNAKPVLALGDAELILFNKLVERIGATVPPGELLLALTGSTDEDREGLYKLVYRARIKLEKRGIPLRIERVGLGRGSRGYRLVVLSAEGQVCPPAS